MSCFYPGLPAYMPDFLLTNVGGSSLEFRLKYSKKFDNFLADIGLLF